MKQGIIVISGNIELISAALIGSGKEEFTHMDVLLDKDHNPFIPATSLVGVLRNQIKIAADKINKDSSCRFWGFSIEDKEYQSALFCSDLICISNDPKIVTRDGIKINSKTGMVDKGAKYDYQVIEPCALFKLNMEIAVNEQNDWDFFRRLAATIQHVLESGEFQIGARTNNGLGKIKLKESKVYEFDFKQQDHVIAWLHEDYSQAKGFLKEVDPFKVKNNGFLIDVEFKLKNSFIIKSYSEEPETPDAVSIKSNDKFIITGSSLKGVIRSRAEKILNSLGKPEDMSKDMIDDLFGFVETENSGIEKNAQKGRIKIDEVLLPDYLTELQTRIKIDRFTGGTRTGALFNSMPVFNDDRNGEEKTFLVKITIEDYKKEEAGLILLVLKDLWKGDLAVAGEKSIGRGVLEGIRAEIKWDDESIILNDEKIRSDDESKNILNEFVLFLINR